MVSTSSPISRALKATRLGRVSHEPWSAQDVARMCQLSISELSCVTVTQTGANNEQCSSDALSLPKPHLTGTGDDLSQKNPNKTASASSSERSKLALSALDQQMLKYEQQSRDFEEDWIEKATDQWNESLLNFTQKLRQHESKSRLSISPSSFNKPHTEQPSNVQSQSAPSHECLKLEHLSPIKRAEEFSSASSCVSSDDSLSSSESESENELRPPDVRQTHQNIIPSPAITKSAAVNPPSINNQNTSQPLTSPKAQFNVVDTDVSGVGNTHSKPATSIQSHSIRSTTVMSPDQSAHSVVVQSPITTDLPESNTSTKVTVTDPTTQTAVAASSINNLASPIAKPMLPQQKEPSVVPTAAVIKRANNVSSSSKASPLPSDPSDCAPVTNTNQLDTVDNRHDQWTAQTQHCLRTLAHKSLVNEVLGTVNGWLGIVNSAAGRPVLCQLYKQIHALLSGTVVQAYRTKRPLVLRDALSKQHALVIVVERCMKCCVEDVALCRVLAPVLAALLLDFPDMRPLMLALFYERCPWVMATNDPEAAVCEQYLERARAVLHLFIAMCASAVPPPPAATNCNGRARDNGLGTHTLWTLTARVLNSMTGGLMQSVYGKQWEKMLRLLRDQVLPQLELCSADCDAEARALVQSAVDRFKLTCSLKPVLPANSLIDKKFWAQRRTFI